MGEKAFFDLLKLYFPTVYDLKYMTSLVDNGRRYLGGLQRLADDLGCQRLGAEHQAGSDSLLTKDAFFALIASKFQDSVVVEQPKDDNDNSSNYNKKHNSSASWFDDTRFANELYGYGNNHTVRKGPQVWDSNSGVGGGGVDGAVVGGMGGASNANLNLSL